MQFSTRGKGGKNSMAPYIELCIKKLQTNAGRLKKNGSMKHVKKYTNMSNIDKVDRHKK